MQASDVQATFNNTLDFPSMVEVDVKGGVGGDEIIVSLSKFESLQELPSQAPGNLGSMEPVGPGDTMQVKSGDAETEIVCPRTYKTCRDGTRVKRDPMRNCRFEPCPIVCRNDTKTCSSGAIVQRRVDLDCRFEVCPGAMPRQAGVASQSREVHISITLLGRICHFVCLKLCALSGPCENYTHLISP